MATSDSMQVFQDACHTLAAKLTPYGFKYRKSKLDLRRQGPLFEHVVMFGTSRSINSLPGHVHLEVRAMASSPRLADYRRAAGIELPFNAAFLFDTTAENVFRPAPPYIRYDVGDPHTRGAVLAGIASILCTEVLRAFDLIESPSALQEMVNAGGIPGLDAEGVRDYFACFEAVRKKSSAEPGRRTGPGRRKP